MENAAPTDVEHGTREPVEPSRAVVAAVANAEGVDPTDLEPLYDVIDPDSLDAVFRSKGRAREPTTTGEIRFTYQGHRVRVSAGGRVSLEDAE